MLVVVLVVSVNLAVAVVQSCTRVHSLAAPPAKRDLPSQCFAKIVKNYMFVVVLIDSENVMLVVVLNDAFNAGLTVICPQTLFRVP